MADPAVEDTTIKSDVYDPFRPDGALEGSAADAEGIPAPMAEYGGNEAGADPNEETMGTVIGASQSGAANLANPLGTPRAAHRNQGTVSADPSRPVSSASNPHSERSDHSPSSRGKASRRGTTHTNPGSEGANSSARRRSTIRDGSRRQSVAGQSANMRRTTLASMMLAGGGDHAAGNSGVFGTYGESEAGTGSNPGQEGGGEGGAENYYGDDYADEEDAQAGERLEAEQIFMPNMRREAFVPVRIARDKIKQVLKEMAQMKHMHFAALETMERQHEFLKAQLESTVAKYARKLTADYNERVRGLEAEYKRRLDNLNQTALGDLQATLEAAQRDSRNLELKMKQQAENQEREIEHERKLMQNKIQITRIAQEDLERDLEKARAESKAKDARIEELIIEVRVAKATAARQQDSTPDPTADDAGIMTDLQDRNNKLTAELAEVRQDHEEAVTEVDRLRAALSDRDQEIAQLHEQLAAGVDGGGELVVGDGEAEDDAAEGGEIEI